MFLINYSFYAQFCQQFVDWLTNSTNFLVCFHYGESLVSFFKLLSLFKALQIAITVLKIVGY